jgi:pimeloyl-ACP methyl ester carboxylesterase
MIRRALLLAVAGLSLVGCATHGDRLALARPTGQGASSAFVDCRGPRTDRPTVVLEAGAFGTSADWARVERDLARSGRVCAYDRLGLGRSPDRKTTPTPEQIAEDLADILDAHGETRPIVLAGHSNGALYAEAFATLYPDRVAGLAYVDGVGTADLDFPLVRAELEVEEQRAQVAAIGGLLGLSGLVVGPIIDAIGLPAPAALRKRQALTSPRHLADARDEVMQILPALPRIRDRGGAPPDIPVAVIVASQHPERPVDQAWRAAQAAPARRACQGWVLDADGATHVSPLGRDRAYVEAAIRWLRTPGLKDATVCDAAIYKP